MLYSFLLNKSLRTLKVHHCMGLVVMVTFSNHILGG